MHRDLVVAIDGGGTKTVLIIADASCRVLGVGRGGPLNAVFVAEQEAIASVRQAATAALARTGLTKSAVGGYELPVAALYASAPGASPEIISSGVSGLLIPEAVLVEGDEFATHAGALGGDCGVVVLAGTGSFAFGRASDGSIASAGGFGPLLGDEGSAYDIGLSALRLAAMASEGRSPHTTLSTLALDHFKAASWPDLARMSLSREAVAGFAQATSRAAHHGDATAAAVLSRAGSDLGRLGAHVAQQLLPHHDGSLKITLVGGASTAGPCLTNAFADAVASSDDRCMVGPPAYSPCVGALMLALGMVGVAMNDEVIRNMEQSIIDNPELGEYSSLWEDRPMMGLGKAYLDEVRTLVDNVENTQAEKIREAAKAIADSVANNGAVHLMDTGHMLMNEMFGRVGGLMMLRPVTINIAVDNPGPRREGKSKATVYLDEIPGLPEFVLERSDIHPGDVLIIGSVSGKNALPVGLALAARQQGVTVIALTSVAYSKSLESAHPSGKRLFEAADIVLDNCGIIGDAVLDVEGMDVKVCPTSGIAAALLMWTLEAQIVQEMLARGLKPHAWLSNHLPGADSFNKTAKADTERLGY